MELTVKNKYDGLPEEIADELKQGNGVYGYFWESPEQKLTGWLTDYNSFSTYRYTIVRSGEIKHRTKNFIPIKHS